MALDQSLGEFEQIVLLAVLRLDEQAYGASILREIELCTGRSPAPGALYTTLHRLESKGLVSSREGIPTAERGGRAKRLIQVTGPGRAALRRAQTAYQTLLAGLELFNSSGGPGGRVYA